MRSYSEVHYLLHRLWTRAVGTPDYEKADWKTLEGIIDELWHEATGKYPTLADVRGHETAFPEVPRTSTGERPTAWKRILR